MGGATSDPVRLSFLLPRELDERLGLSALIERHLVDPRKEGKEATHWTRLSCHRFRAEVRLLLGVIAYDLGNLLRQLVLPLAIQSCSLTSLQQRLFKTGGRLIRHARYFILQLAESHLTPTLFRQIVGRIERLVWHPT